MIPSKVRLRHDEKLKDRFAGEFFFSAAKTIGQRFEIKGTVNRKLVVVAPELPYLRRTTCFKLLF